MKNNKDANQKLQAVITQISQGLKMDGGDLELVSFAKGVVSVRLKGACLGCPMALTTFSEYIEKEIREQLPEIKEVKLV